VIKAAITICVDVFLLMLLFVPYPKWLTMKPFEITLFLYYLVAAAKLACVSL
jgi:hypothetical protein